ncbi:MAG: tRNA (adenosine(37)-N6)-dimethylallyltransferase MiaA [Phycisphaeraceae bacterium]|nr:tRNA (adenosine(37)-N6)-dimethylallyltransferase MiaA [Phycisphaeraceae bacterium]MCB9848344.1 tRNA (adenosine(37)-N6)-dimethylallyltransferase MiaA [Phycisphaeraceae bacterium]
MPPDRPEIPIIPVIIGPTAGGKTALAVELAHRFADRSGVLGEVISADSIQIYRRLDIGSAKPTEAERRGVPHHLIDIAEPTEPCSVDRWLREANEAIKSIRSRGAAPIVVGGTHLYIKAFLEGLFDGPPPDPALRARLAALSGTDRRARLERIDPQAAARIHPNDERRTIRALEVFEQTGIPLSEHQSQWDRGDRRADAFPVALLWPTPLINARINARVRLMIYQGLVEEARSLWNAGDLEAQAGEALGYKQLAAHFRGEVPLDKAIEQIRIETRRFAKNQRTWLRRLVGAASVADRATGLQQSIYDDPNQAPSFALDAGSIDPEAWPGLVLQALDAAAAR